MYQKFVKVMRELFVKQKGMTGLETAIILIAFVTVASVLAYSVLSAGIFSAERGKATVYSGLEQAQSTMEVHGSVIGDSAANVSMDYVEFLLGLTIPTEAVDMDALVVNVYSSENQSNLTKETWDGSVSSARWQAHKATGSTERGATNNLEGDEMWVVLVDTSNFDTIANYDWFTVEVIPPKGSSLTIKRTLPGQLTTKMDLK
jgi:archaeal flagellin FlaB